MPRRRGSHRGTARSHGGRSPELAPSEQSVALDRAGITVFRDITFLAAGPASERSRSGSEIASPAQSPCARGGKKRGGDVRTDRRRRNQMNP